MSTIDQDRAKFLRTRRSFLTDFGAAALGSLGVSATLRDFRLINAALAQGNGPFAFPDYKAMICVFMSGGNDSNNLIVPRNPAAHSNYASIRQNLTIPVGSLLPINPQNNDGNEYGFHPSCTGLQNMFETGKAAVLFNVGPLLFPTTRIQYQKKTIALPPQLFSHSDQVTHWQTSLPDQPPRSGWGGRIADYLHPMQDQLINDLAERAKIALCTSIAGSNTFEVGATIQQYHVSTTGAVTMAGAGNANTVTQNRENTIRGIARIPQDNLQAGAFGSIIDDAMATGSLLNDAIDSTKAANYFTTPFPTGSFGDQMKMVARIIAARDVLKIRRQIFFVTFGSYDTHTSQIGTNDTDPLIGTHANLLGQLSNGIAALSAAMNQLGGSTLQNSVVGFTASDFGRTFPTNGQGSDHGWGSHHILFGGNGTANGALRGKRTYGNFPVLQVNGPDDTSTGRWIPTTSVDEYSATFAKWFGVDQAHMPVVFPNVGRFGNPDLGFMNS
ncbi:DUF1501 domain-containing protein [Luteolibacter sp. Populi]|uniref:DUF1501 domain-containing protein n=1 Tax=Luteolibacter sp. Populi TaxID=3230487 RepID=UPI00346678D7